MAFRLAKGEPISAGLTRALVEAIDDARDSLFAPDLAAEVRIHLARRRLKRARTLVRVLRPLFGSSYRDEVHRLRDAARMLSGTRDADVAAATAAALMADASGREREVLVALHANLAAEAARMHETAVPIDQAVARLDEARAAASYLPTPFDGTALLFDAIGETYAAEHRARQRAEANGGPERFHDWRKLVKHRWHLMRLSEGRLKAANGRLIERLDTLGETLGLVNDCQVLHERIGDTPTLAGTVRAAGHAQRAIAARREALKADAFTVAEKLYGKGPKAYAKSLRLK